MRYYSKLRPVGPGTYPKSGATDIHNYNDKIYVKDAGQQVWGYIEYNRELTPEELRSYELIPGGKEDDVDLLEEISRLEERLYYEAENRPELETAANYMKEAVLEIGRATGCTISGAREPEQGEAAITLMFRVERRSISVTQQYADVYCNGEKIVSGFGDDKEIIEVGERYYGTLSGGCWASRTPDTQFIKGAIFPLYDRDQSITGKLRELLDREIEKERATAKAREEKGND